MYTKLDFKKLTEEEVINLSNVVKSDPSADFIKEALRKTLDFTKNNDETFFNGILYGLSTAIAIIESPNQYKYATIIMLAGLIAEHHKNNFIYDEFSGLEDLNI